MKHKIVVIGCGNVGLDYIEQLALEPNIAIEIVLIDPNQERIQGEVLDLEQALALKNKTVSLRIGDYHDCETADIVCLCAGLPQSMADRLDDLEGANNILRQIVEEVMKHHFTGIFLVATNPLDVSTYLVAYYADYPYEKVIGTGTMLDTIRLKSLLSKTLAVSPSSITAYVLGEHGNSQFVAWNNANIGLQNINTLLSEEQKNQFALSTKEMGSTIIAYKKFTNHGIAACLTRLTMAILKDEHIVYPVSNYQQEFGIYLSTPVMIGRQGVEKKVAMKLSAEEQKAFAASAAVIKASLAKVVPPELY